MITGYKNIKMYVVNEDKSDYIFQHLKFGDNELHLNTYRIPNKIEFRHCELVNFKIVFIKEKWYEKILRVLRNLT